MKLFVIYGYCGPDNYTSDNGPIMEIEEFDSEQEVERLYEEFMEECDDRDCSDVTFRIIKGTELKMGPVEKVTKYKLK